MSLPLRSAIAALLALASLAALGQEPAAEAASDGDGAEAAANEAPAEPQGDGITSPKTLSGMSILGNEEAPKALVIVPWKSSEIGDDIDLDDSLDERARPVDKDVFLRELRFHDIRSGK